MGTAGKGPGIVFRAQNGTGTVRVSPRERRSRAALEVLDAAGGITQISLAPDELRALASALLKVAAALQAVAEDEEVTQV